MSTTTLPCGFIECTSMTFSYDIMGRVTISYTTVHQSADFCYTTTIPNNEHFLL